MRRRLDVFEIQVRERESRDFVRYALAMRRDPQFTVRSYGFAWKNFANATDADILRHFRLYRAYRAARWRIMTIDRGGIRGHLADIDRTARIVRAQVNAPRFSVLQPDLAQALKNVKAGDCKRKEDIFTHVRIETGDREIVLSWNGETARLSALVIQTGKTAIHYKTLADIVKLLLPDRIDFMPDNRHTYDNPTVITARCGMSRITFKANVLADDLAPPHHEGVQLSVAPPSRRRIAKNKPQYASV